MINLAVFVSGRGSNLRALFNEFYSKENAPQIKFVVSNKPDCPALAFACEKGIQTLVLSKKSNNQKVTYEELAVILHNNDVRLIVLAGFLKKIPEEFIDKFKGKIINIHPALLPKYGGKGMYGMNVHKAVFESGEKYSGATVHFVDNIYDHGEIILQEKILVENLDSPEEISEAVLRIEHKILPQAVFAVVNQMSEKVGNNE